MKKVEFICIPSFAPSVPIKITVFCNHEHEIDMEHIQKCIDISEKCIALSDKSNGNISYCYDIELKLKPHHQGNTRHDSAIPRRNIIALNTPVELSIRKAIEEVETLPASAKLTDAVVKLNDALNLVADVTDEH